MEKIIHKKRGAPPFGEALSDDVRLGTLQPVAALRCKAESPTLAVWLFLSVIFFGKSRDF